VGWFFKGVIQIGKRTKFRKTKKGLAICPFFIWTSENIEGLGHSEEDVNLTYCNHSNNSHDFEGNCGVTFCPLLKE